MSASLVWCWLTLLTAYNTVRVFGATRTFGAPQHHLHIHSSSSLSPSAIVAWLALECIPLPSHFSLSSSWVSLRYFWPCASFWWCSTLPFWAVAYCGMDGPLPRTRTSTASSFIDCITRICTPHFDTYHNLNITSQLWFANFPRAVRFRGLVEQLYGLCLFQIGRSVLDP